jgi:hypothetical protein
MRRLPTVAEREVHDLAERVFVLKEALRDLIHLDQLERSGLARPCDQREQWNKAFKAAENALSEDGPDDRRAA